MLELDNIDLTTDAAAAHYIKNEEVDVAFARSTGELISREGPNRFQPGDALITGSTGDRWSVSRDRFDEKYEPVAPLTAGSDGHYRARPVPVLARQMAEPFTVARSQGGDRLRGEANDWLLQYAPGDYGIVENARFVRVYRRQGESVLGPADEMTQGTPPEKSALAGRRRLFGAAPEFPDRQPHTPPAEPSRW